MNYCNAATSCRLFKHCHSGTKYLKVVAYWLLKFESDMNEKDFKN